MIQLLARKEQIKARDPDQRASIATVLRVVRQMMLRDTVVPKRTERFAKQLAQVVVDDYQRISKKANRGYPEKHLLRFVATAVR